MTVLVSAQSAGIAGSTNVPGDKSVSHRALIFGALAVGETVVTGLLEGEDVLRTAQALRQLGAEIIRDDTVGGGAVWRIWGVGIGGLRTPDDILDMGNSGTGARLLMGLVAGHPVTAIFTGDDSLRGRPMGRVTVPLADIGAQIESRPGGLLPVTVHGAADPLPIIYRLPVASAQVKSAILLAGLNSQGVTTVLEPEATRDHTERMLRYFGATIRVADETDEQGKPVRRIELTGQPELIAAPVSVPGDPSSAAFAAVAAAIVPGSDVMIRNIGLNPLRTGLFETLEEMGADLEWRNRRDQGGEPVADLCVRSGPLHGVEPPAGRAPSMIDEYPILAVAAACAKGVTVLRGLAELRVKESDRLAAMANGLAACGVEVEELEDGLIIHGCDGPPSGGATGENRVVTHMDHRIAMAFLVLGMAAQSAVEIDDGDMIATSFPTFVDMMNGLGGRVSPESSRATA